MIQVRRSVFETNSSNVHSITMCTEADWLNWEKGNLIYDDWDEKLISKKEVKYKNDKQRYYSSPDELFDRYQDLGYETYKLSYRGIISFGYYGHD